MEEYAAVDRIEGKYAICETDNGMKNILISKIPFEVTQGDVLVIEVNGDSINILRKDDDEKKRRADYNNALLEQLFFK